MIPLALEAAAGLRPYLEVFGNDYPTADGTCIRDYIHVTDLAEAHATAVDFLQNQSGGSFTALNLGTGEGQSVRQIATTVEQVTSRTLPLRVVGRRPGDPPSLVADPTQAQRLLNWSATRSLEETIASAWKWLNSARRQQICAEITARDAIIR